MRQRMADLARDTQAEITAAIGALDGTDFREDTWERPGGGGGSRLEVSRGTAKVLQRCLWSRSEMDRNRSS